MSSRVTTSAGGGGGVSRSSQSTSQRRHRSRSTSRYADLDKPKKKKTLSATTSLVSIPNTIKLSMLNSGLLSFEKVKLEARDENNSLSQTIPDKPIELRHFVKLCEQRRKFPVLYKLEFQTAVKVETNTCRHATRKNNVEKNQNQKCIPYDYNRVVLEKIPGIPDSDYVNASYVDSLLKPNAYIVTQGPTEETVNEFWRMIWQENVSAIVMLTKTFDFTKVMCVQYWPPNCEVHETYGDININIVKEEQLANFQIRTFRLYKKNAEGHVIEERLILQFHYTEWHSHTCPFSNAVLEFRRRVRAVVGNIIKPNSMVGPILVHCNDGGGRSGVYLAIDANLELAEEEDCFHVFGYLKKLRQSRKGLIENVDQYKFVYDTLEEHIVCGKTWFPVTELSEKLKMKAKKDTVTKMNEYQREYAQICKQTPRFTIGDCAGGHRADNREKNRDVLCVPPDNFRPYLTSFQGNAFTDYINSVFVDGYTKPREYIVTEWPQKHTLGEFWSLVYDHECSAVVVLCQPPPNSQQFPSFWPQKSKMEKYGPVFSVHFVSGKHYQNIKQWEYRINKKIISLTEMMAGVKAPTKTVQLFQLTCWPMGHKVPTSTNSLVFLMNMVELWRQRTDYGPVCVVSPDGRSRAGVYCAANACIEQVIQHGEVDVFQAVKTVRRHRPQLIDNMTEYKYCYDLVLHYVLHFLDKDHKEKKFIAFGRGKCIPLTPDSLNAELPSEISNTGRIVVNKCIDKIDKRELLHEKDIFNQNHLLDRAAKISERKKKGRLYSLGGNEPQRKGHRGRLDRLKTVGTFDLGTEMSVLSEVARNLNEKLITGELGVLHSLILPPDDTRRPSMTPSNLSSMHNTSVRNTPESRKRDLNRSTSSFKPEYHRVHLKSPLLQAKNGGEFKPQHSADDCVQRSILTPTSAKKSRSLSTSSYLNKEKLEQAINYSQTSEARNYKPSITQTSTITMNTDSSLTEKNESPIFQRCDQRVLTKQTSEVLNLPEKIESEKLQEDITSHEDTRKNTEFSYRTRKSMLRKSRRIVRTDSEIFKEGIIGEKNEIILVQNADIQIHANPDSDKTREVPSDSCRNSSVTSSSMQSRKDSSDFDDICSPREPQKSTDESSKNISTDDMDAVFSDSNTDLEKLEKEYKELIKSNLQREYKSDGDTLDEIGKKRNDFGKWKNQSLEHEFEFSNQELMNIVGGDQTLSSYSYGTSTDMKDMSRICSPESCTNGAYSDSGVKGLDDKYMSYSKIRSRVYSSSRLGETPTERERLHPININDHDSYISSMQMQAVSDDQTLDRSTTTKSTLIRPSILEINVNNDNRSKTENPTAGSTNTEGTITSLFERRFGKFKKVNKLLKCKRFSTSTLYEKKKTSTTDDTKGPNRIINKLSGKLHHTNTKQSSSNLLEAKSLFSSSKLSLFSQKPGKSSIFSSKKSSMFSSASSHSNNELFSHTSSKTKLSEVSKSNTELSKYRTSPSRFNSKKSSKTGKTNSSACLNSNICHSPLSEEFYNKTGSVRLSAMELYEKFCSEDFGGLYKHETFKNDERHDGFANQHEYRLEKKGLRAIGRYHKNARLLKQKSEPKFNFRSSAGGGEVAYYHEEDEYYYNRKPQEPYEYYNEQDEYYDEYDDEYDEDGEGDYYEDEEGDYYEDDVEFDEHANINDSNIQVITDDECGAVCLPHHLHSTKEENEAGTSADSDVDEIFLMPEGSKCSDYDEYGFENKHFSLEHSMLVHANGKNISLNYLNTIEQDDLSSDTEVVTEIRKGYEKYPDDDVLTIYKICSREDVCKVTSDVEVIHEPSSHRSSSLQCESLEQAVNEYMKNALEPSITRTDCITSSIDRTDSLELLSNSSGTIRSRSTFTEYAFDTVKNLNLDSCSTSKLSLSLKSEVFDDFTITPDDIKPIQNCEFEDFTLTPEGSVCEGGSGSGGATISGEVAAQSMKNPTTTTTTEKEVERDESKSPLDDEYQNKVVIIVDKFLANERNLRQSSYTDEEADQNSDVIDDIRKEDSDKGETVKQEQTEDDQCTTTYLEETQENTAVADDENKSLDSSSDKDLIGTGNELTVVDLYDDDEHTISLFTSELTKEFDRLFSRAEKSQYGGETSFEHHSSSSDIMDNEEDLLRRSSKIPSRQSMQKLEPYFIADPPEDNCTSNKDLDKDLMSTSLKNSEYTKVFGVRDNLAATAAAARSRTITSITLKNSRSQSLGNLNKKTKCFPL